MKHLFILDPTKPFRGSCQTTMTCKDSEEPVHVDYCDTPTTFEQYKQKAGNENLIAIPYEELDEKYMKPYLDSLCGEWAETTEKRFIDMLEVLPPAKWEHKGDIEYFLVGECVTGNLYSCFVCDYAINKYYTALRPIRITFDEIKNSLPNN